MFLGKHFPKLLQEIRLQFHLKTRLISVAAICLFQLMTAGYKSGY